MVAGLELGGQSLGTNRGVFDGVLYASFNRVVLMLSWYACDIVLARVGFDSRGMQVDALTDQQDRRRLLPYRCLVYMQTALTMLHLSSRVYSQKSRNAAPSPIRRVGVRS
jgi:hypothetical protein